MAKITKMKFPAGVACSYGSGKRALLNPAARLQWFASYKLISLKMALSKMQWLLLFPLFRVVGGTTTPAHSTTLETMAIGGLRLRTIQIMHGTGI